MSLFKKLSLLICAMAIAFAIVPITPNLHTAFADEEVKCKVSGVANFYFTENDRTAPPRLFDAYKLVNITYVSGTVDTPLYGVEKVDANVDAAILKAFKAAGVEPSSTSGTIALAKLMPDDWTLDVNRTSDVRKVANELAKITNELGTPKQFRKTYSGNSFNGMFDIAIYLLVDKTADINNTTGYTAVAPILVKPVYKGTCTNFEGRINIKSTKTEITKELKAGTISSAFKDQKLSFTVKTIVPTRAEYEAGTFQFYVKDVLPDGLTYVPDSAKVKTHTTPETNGVQAEAETQINPSISADTHTLVWNFSDKKLTSADTLTLDDSGTVEKHPAGDAGTTLEITYDALIGENFVSGNVGNTNTATVKYNNTKTSFYEASDTETTYQGKIIIQKKDTSGDLLSGATFKVTSGSEYDKTVLDATKGDNNDGAADANLEFGHLKVSEQGVSYTVAETVAPDGYQTVPEFTVKAKLVKRSGVYKIEYELEGADATSVQYNNQDGVATIIVTDRTAIENLASTGGKVAGILAIAGVLFVIGVALGRVRRKIQK